MIEYYDDISIVELAQLFKGKSFGRCLCYENRDYYYSYINKKCRCAVCFLDSMIEFAFVEEFLDDLADESIRFHGHPKQRAKHLAEWLTDVYLPLKTLDTLLEE